mmetsp:Transcript_8640/g.21263  ORF Transcript_8640/g.21263 Transcript_8640/m.21263 type:complete len:252 (+) Transcript_8640:797-1552(+)
MGLRPDPPRRGGARPGGADGFAAGRGEHVQLHGTLQGDRVRPLRPRPLPPGQHQSDRRVQPLPAQVRGRAPGRGLRPRLRPLRGPRARRQRRDGDPRPAQEPRLPRPPPAGVHDRPRLRLRRPAPGDGAGLYPRHAPAPARDLSEAGGGQGQEGRQEQEQYREQERGRRRAEGPDGEGADQAVDGAGSGELPVRRRRRALRRLRQLRRRRQDGRAWKRCWRGSSNWKDRRRRLSSRGRRLRLHRRWRRQRR